MRRANAELRTGSKLEVNTAYQILVKDAAALDAKAKLVVEEIDKRKQPPLRESLARSLRVRFAKGEITKDDYEQMLKMLKQR